MMMMPLATTPHPNSAALQRLACLASLDDGDTMVLQGAMSLPRSAGARRDMTASLADLSGVVLMLDGWAYRANLLADGRRQITELLLPGDLLADPVGFDGWDESVTAITAVSYCLLPAGSLTDRPGFANLVTASGRAREAKLRRQVVRLGRLDALERTADWLVEIYDRLDAVGSAGGESMPWPLTQEIMADILGLTSVHVNRTLGALRREGLVNVHGGRVVFLDRERCRLIARRA